MCTLTHFTHTVAPSTDTPSTLHSVLLSLRLSAFEQPIQPRFRVVLAGKAFFHIKEISTDCVRAVSYTHLTLPTNREV